MKQMIIACFVVCFAACNTTSTNQTGTTDSVTEPVAAAKLDYPYIMPSGYPNWQPGDQQHVVNVMKALQAFEKGDVAASMQYFADTVIMRFDYMDASFFKDSLQKYFTAQRDALASLQVTMNDWESVISADKSQEYVTMWYKEKWVDKKGKSDSVKIVDDVKMVNRKITELDEKIQHFPPAKK